MGWRHAGAAGSLPFAEPTAGAESGQAPPEQARAGTAGLSSGGEGRRLTGQSWALFVPRWKLGACGTRCAEGAPLCGGSCGQHVTLVACDLWVCLHCPYTQGLRACDLCGEGVIWMPGVPPRVGPEWVLTGEAEWLLCDTVGASTCVSQCSLRCFWKARVWVCAWLSKYA